jgi:aminoglycoside phosphotransferase (APT) family kinase protein
VSLGVTVDPTAPEAGARILDAIRTGGVSLPGPGLSPSLVRVSPLGLGESYAAWLVTDGAASVVIRLARRRPEDMACPMIDEFRAGPLIPDGIGSRPLAMDDSADNPLGAPYLVSTFAPGVVREPSAWDPPLLRAHARRLAVLHQRRLALAGPVGGTGSRLDIVDEFDGAYSWWRSAHPEVAETPEAAALARLIRPRLAAAAPAFDGIDYALIHGDLVATNVVVDPSGTPRYIDWEWARIGDVANDLALIGGRITGGPWYVPMDADTLDEFLREYHSARADHAPESTEPIERLRTRRDAWELMERFLSSLHFEFQSHRSPTAAMYAQATRDIRDGLRAVLDDVR